MNLFRPNILCLFLLSFLLEYSYGQLSAPQPESVYGGRIRSIAAIPIHADTSRVFITTESANSMFMADMYTPGSGTPAFGAFTVLPALNDAAGFGGNIEQIAAHATSGNVFFIHNGELRTCHPASSTTSNVAGPGLSGFQIEDDHLLYLKGAEFHFGLIDASGNYMPSSASPLILPPVSGRTSVHIHPVNNKIYVFGEGNTPQLLYLDEAYDSISGTKVFVDISPTALTTTPRWSAFGIAPDSMMFFAGSDVHNKYVASSRSNAGPWASYNTGLFGAPGNTLGISGDTANYFLYYGSAYNSNKGLAGHWQTFGTPGGFETHPNDGPVCVDPNRKDIIYMSTDMGIGASTDKGRSIFEINKGVEAVQVKDFQMTGDKNTAWLASKSGIRKVSNYLTSPTWTSSIFPTGDGSPYHAVSMAKGDTNKVYAGNIRVYKTKDGGHSWHSMFSATNPPYNFPAFGTPTQGASRISALEVCPIDTGIVMAGYVIEGADEGGLFVTLDGGRNWSQILLEASAIGNDVDVQDIVFNLEGSDTVAYIGVEYDLASPAGRSVYKLAKNGINWIVSRDMDAGGTSTGSLIVATINDLEVSSTGDTIFAAGTDAGINHPIAYYKPLNSTAVWTPFTTSGFPFVVGKEGKAVTLGIDTVYVAVENEVYFHALGSSSWKLGYSYPVGTEIHFLYYDELLVGTGTGLYGHIGVGDNTTVEPEVKIFPLTIHPNPASEIAFIEFDNSSREPFTLTMYNQAGEMVYTRKNIRNSELRMELQDLSQGIYIIQIKGSRQLFSGKLMVR